METRRVIVTVELETQEAIAFLKQQIRETLDKQDFGTVKQIQANVIQKKK